MSRVLLSFSLTPVQSFIEAARSVRDLKAGSEILSHLTLQAMKVIPENNGVIIYPATPGENQPANIPNIFLAQFDTYKDAEKAAEICKYNIEKRWEEIADTVHNELDKSFKILAKNWDEGWGDQISKFWEPHSVILNTADVPAILQAVDGKAPSGTPGNADEFRALQILIQNHKLNRHFPGDNGVGRHSCALMGEWEQMGPVGLSEADKFWGDIAQQDSIKGLRLKKRDRLCAPSLVKRYCLLDPDLKDSVGEKMPDTAGITTKYWWDKIAMVQRLDECMLFQSAVERLQNLCGNTKDTEGRYLLDDNLTAKTIIDDLGLDEKRISAERFNNINRAVSDVNKARTALLNKADENNKTLEAPPRYYAILVQDGDKMGDWLKKIYGTDDTSVAAPEMSQELQGYIQKVKEIVKSHSGFLVYAGGDDALTMLPLSEAIACAKELEVEYPDFRSNKQKDSRPTLSAGIAIVHYMYDLRSALREARAAEHRAKEEGRDALGINLVLRSGGPRTLTLPWDKKPDDKDEQEDPGLLNDLTDLQKLFNCGVSDGWLQNVAELPEAILNDAIPVTFDAVKCLIGQATRRLQLNAEEKAAVAVFFNNQPNTPPIKLEDAEEKAREYVRDLWRKIWDVMDGRYENLCKQRASEKDYPSKDTNKFLKRMLDLYINFGLTGSFLDRGRE